MEEKQEGKKSASQKESQKERGKEKCSRLASGENCSCRLLQV